MAWQQQQQKVFMTFPSSGTYSDSQITISSINLGIFAKDPPLCFRSCVFHVFPLCCHTGYCYSLEHHHHYPPSPLQSLGWELIATRWPVRTVTLLMEKPHTTLRWALGGSLAPIWLQTEHSTSLGLSFLIWVPRKLPTFPIKPLGVVWSLSHVRLLWPHRLQPARLL